MTHHFHRAYFATVQLKQSLSIAMKR